MSAFMCSDEHVNRILDAAREADRYSDLIHVLRDVPGELLSEKLTNLGRMMHAENTRSMLYRYDGVLETTEEQAYRQMSQTYVYVRGGDEQRTTTPVEALKLISSWRYQSCEHPDPEQLTWGLVASLEKMLISALPGYNAAPWSV